MEVVFFKSPSDLRKWLQENHDEAKELWVGFYKKNSSETGITNAEALDEALCFGWIDGVRKSLDEMSYTIRFSRRKPGSTWSIVNFKRAGELSELGLMQPSGLKAFRKRDEAKSRQYSYEARTRKLDDIYEKQFRANKRAWEFFQAQAPGYQRTANWWIMSAKKEETRLRRLAALIEESEKGRKMAAITSPSKA